MQLAEPTETRFDLVFSLFGVPVRVHPLFWAFMSLLGASQMRNQGVGQMLISLGIWLVAVFISLIVHEMGHALMSRRFGATPRIAIHAMGGLTSFRQPPRRPRDQLMVTLAGPFAGFIFAALLIAGIALSQHSVGLFGIAQISGANGGISGNLGNFIGNLLVINIFWGLFNLMPVLPLDGGLAVLSVLQQRKVRGAHELAFKISIAAGIGLTIASAFVLNSPFMAIMFGFMAYQSYQQLQGGR